MATVLLTRCPHCGARFRLKDESAAGKQMKCRECETAFTIKLAKPGGSRAANGKAAGVGTKQRAKPQPADDEGGGEIDDFDDFDSDSGGGAASPSRLPPRRSTKKKPKRTAAAAAAVEDTPVRQKPPADIGKMVRLGGGGVLGVGVLAAMWFVFFQPSEPIQPPAAYGTFEHPKDAFACEYPEGWEQEAGGDTVRWAKWTRGDAKIHLRVGAAGGALSDLATVGSDPNEQDDSLKPEAQLHESPFIKNPVVEEYSGYEELSSFTVQSQTGGVRVSDFKASGLHGFRATAIVGQGALRIVCHCRESDWDVCKPIFERVIQSISR